MKKYLLGILALLGVGTAGVLGGGYYNQANTNRQMLSTLTTTEITTTTIKTVNFSNQTSTLHIKVDLIANATGSSNGAGWYCNADFRRSSTTRDLVTQIGTTNCHSNLSSSTWGFVFATTTGGVKLNVNGNTSTTVNWNAFVESYELK